MEEGGLLAARQIPGAQLHRAAIGQDLSHPLHRSVVAGEKEDLDDATEILELLQGHPELLANPGFFYMGDAMDGSENTIYHDVSHTTEEGNAMVAERIAAVLLEVLEAR